MPNQNLPQPKIPGQLSTAGSTANSNPVPASTSASTSAPASAPTLNPSPSLTPTPPPPPSSAPTPTPSSPTPPNPTSTSQLEPTTVINPSQPPSNIPGALSRENPAGLPPKLPSLQADGPLTKPTELKVNQEAEPAEVKESAPASLAAAPSPSSPATTKSVPVQAPAPLPAQAPALASTPSPVVSAKTNPTAEANQAKSANPTPKSKQKKFKLNIPKPAMIVLGLLLLLILVLLGLNMFSPTRSNKKNDVNNAATSSNSDSNSAANGASTQTGGVIPITYWGLWEDSAVLKEVLADFEAENQIHVDYRKQSHRDYRERLEQAILSGNGPDVFRYHATWVPMLSKHLAAMPNTVMTSSEYQQTFYPIAYEQLQSNGQIVGIPLMYDGLALFYNQDMLRTANINVPTTWSELRSAANKLTVPSNPSERNKDNINRGGLAIGNASNVEHFADILGLLILQNGGDPANPETQYVTDALTFYTNFIEQDQVWSDRLPSSTVAFARGEVAMMFAPSWRALEIKALNPELDFAITQVPQLSSDKNITWASYWVEGVNKSSKKQDAAWKLLAYLSSKEVQQKLYNSMSLVRTFGAIYSRQDLAAQLSSDVLLGAYLKDAPHAQAFPMASFTHDNGINDQVIQYYASAIDAVLAGADPAVALEETASGVAQVLNKYNY